VEARRANFKGFSPSLQRARKPFLIPNIIVGSLVASFVGGIYLYAISAVKQDDFVSDRFLLWLSYGGSNRAEEGGDVLQRGGICGRKR